jgi:hypothetical protein
MRERISFCGNVALEPPTPSALSRSRAGLPARNSLRPVGPMPSRDAHLDFASSIRLISVQTGNDGNVGGGSSGKSRVEGFYSVSAKFCMVKPFGVGVVYTNLTQAHGAGENNVGGSMSRLFDFFYLGRRSAGRAAAYRACCVGIAARESESSR